MLENIRKIKIEIEEHLQQVKNANDLETWRGRFLVRKGELQKLFEQLKNVSAEQKPICGKELNLVSKYAESEYARLKEIFSDSADTSRIDVTLPGRHMPIGSLHPVRQILDEMITIFRSMGFDIAEGPQIEDEYHNFDALNFQPDHPARDMQDTFFIKSNRKENNILLRTHTSPVQIRVMQTQNPPIRCIMPGRVYRNEAISSRSLAEFHQIEGLYINKNVSFAELKGTMMTFAKRMYGENAQFRFRPSFFPFTEPSAEMDMSCFICKGSGCRICKNSGWLEIVGCGMVHPDVLRNGGINPDEYIGYAFGFGIERVALLRTGISDIRYFYENDIRILQQF